LTFAEYARSLLRGTGLLRAARYRQERYAAIAPVRLYPPVARLPGIFPPQGHWLGVAGLRQDGPQGGAPLGAPAWEPVERPRQARSAPPPAGRREGL